MFKVNNKDTRMMQFGVFINFEHISHLVSIVNFEHVNAKMTRFKHYVTLTSQSFYLQ